MIFQERKKEAGYTYDVEDIFGTITIESSTKLTADILDDMVVLLLRQNLNAGVITGEVKHKGGIVKYVFKPRAQWEEDEKESCEDTPTSTPKPESESIATRRSSVPVLSWLKKFAGAFREAWKNANKNHE